MQFVDGESQRARLESEHQLPVEDALRIAREVAEALAYAHERNIIHRDIKPANIMLSRGHALVEQLGVDALLPGPALVHEVDVRPAQSTHLEHVVGRDPRLGQLARVQQISEQPGVGAIGLGVLLASPHRLRVRRLGQVRLEARRGDLLDHVSPASAALHRHCHRLPIGSASISSVGAFTASPRKSSSFFMR